MFCHKCGARLDDTANFCSKCGTRAQHNTSQTTHSTQSKSNYTMYESFDASNDTATTIGGLFNKILSSPNDPATLSRFVLTDHSIITAHGEYSYQQMTVIAPKGSISHNLFGEGFSFGDVTTSINGTVYTLKYSRQDLLRFCFAAVRANEHIPMLSAKQKLQCAHMMYAYLLNAKEIIQKLPVTFEGATSGSGLGDMFTDIFSAQTQNHTPNWTPPTASSPAKGKEPYSEFLECNFQVTVNPGAQLTQSQKQLIENYSYVQRLLNEFFKKHNPISNAGQNHSPFILGKLITFMTDEDVDASAAIAKYNEQIRLQREAEEHRASSQESSNDSYYGSGGILSGAVNRINESNHRKQEMREEMYRQQRMLKDYYNTPKCQRYGLGGKKSCAGCPIAHMCKH